MAAARACAYVSDHKENSGRVTGSPWPSIRRYVSTLMSIQSAFGKAEIIFQDEDAGGGIGVRIAKKP
jgi:hypothetical protein